MTMYRTLLCSAAALLLLNAAGCKSNNEQAEAPATQQQVVTAPAEQQAAEEILIAGKVVETMDASGYTYVNVETATGSVWAAIPQTTVEVGKEISLAPGMEMKDFESKSLGRTFDSVIFSSGLAGGGGTSFEAAVQGEGSQGTPLDMAGSGGSQAAKAASEDVKVDKAEGENAFTVSEIFEKKAELDKQTVVVRGQVVKASMGIMGKNWLHLQDGTGDAAAGTHDLVVTTDGVADKGAVVTVQGVLAADRDFGSGYRYDVIVEEAEIK